MRKCMIVLLLLALHAGIATAQNVDSIGLRMENYTYPFPVKYITATVQLQPVQVAFMDVPAARPNGRTVMLFHGKNFPAAYWEATIRTLNGAGYRVIAPDALGFGKSSKPVIQYSFALLASLARDILDTLGIQKTAVMGHSMGGMLASRFALSFPDRVDRLILEDPLGLEDWRAKGAAIQRVDELYQGELATTYEGIVNYHKTYYYPNNSWKEAYRKWIDLQFGFTKGKNFSQYALVSALTMDMILTQPVLYEFPNIKVPTLVIVGKLDKTKVARKGPEQVMAALGNYGELGKKAAAAIPGAKLIAYEQVGHVPHFQIPDRFHKDVLAFLKEPSGG